MRSQSRREFLTGSMALAAGLWVAPASSRTALAKNAQPAQISITLDLEMSRNFPQWETTHWDYEKGNLDRDTKQYSVDAGKRVRDHGGVIHYFCVGRVLEQENVDWLKGLADDKHPIGNHTYDHVFVLAKQPSEVQFRFQRAPWLMRGKTAFEVIQDNVRMANEALLARTNIKAAGFRTPGGFSTGLDGREDVQKMLQQEGFTWVSSKYPVHANSRAGVRPTQVEFDSIVAAQKHAQPYHYPTGLLEIPMSPISDIGAFRGGRWPLEDFLTAIRLAMTWVIDNGAVFDFLGHPSCLVAMDPQFKAIELICQMVKQAGERAQLVSLDQIARRYATV